MLMEAKLIGWISSKCCEQKCALKFYKKKKLVKWAYSYHNPLLKIGDTAAFFSDQYRDYTLLNGSWEQNE